MGVKDAANKPVIVTVDDDPVILNSIFEVLKPDYTVRPFANSNTALSYLRSNPADLVLLDHYMPSMTGLELLQQLQDDPTTRDTPVIFLTGSMSDEGEVQALEIGAMDYLTKPIKPRSLLTRVRLQLELHGHRHHLEELVEAQTEELRQVNQKLEQRDKATLDLLAKASDMRDHDTGAHILRVELFTEVIVTDLLAKPQPEHQVSEQYGRDIIDSVKLHDLGKLAMPDSVLLKPGKLSPEEFAIIKTHPTYGEQMLASAIEKLGDDSLLRAASEIAHGHHEKWDGSGYPAGASGFNIPLSARIAAVADVFDALTSKRPYKNAWSPEEAFTLIYADAGKHFDPYLTDVVKRHESDFADIVATHHDG